MSRALTALGMVFTVACLISCGGGGGPGAGTAEPGAGAPDAPAAGESPSDRAIRLRAEWRERVQKERAERTAKAQEDLKAAEEALAEGKKKYKRVANNVPTGNQLKAAKADLDALTKSRDQAKAALDAAPNWLPLVNPQDVGEGQVGVLSAGPNLVPVFKVFQVVDPNTVLLEYRDALFWVELSTRNLVDGQTVTLPGFVEGLGTRQYATPLGSTRTVRAFRHLGE